ncbi:MAG: hypothetical protein JOZ10_16840 [Acidobacteria bacterium]|nr:hypothetical protein [Acidobacteriota bacterium]MBV9146446.1 hypothetical protein [Acidobacteriota bacterium]
MINADDEDAKGAEEISAAAERFSLSRLAGACEGAPAELMKFGGSMRWSTLQAST